MFTDCHTLTAIMYLRISQAKIQARFRILFVTADSVEIDGSWGPIGAFWAFLAAKTFERTRLASQTHCQIVQFMGTMRPE